MPGMDLLILESTSYDFTAAAQGAAKTIGFPITVVDVSQYREATLEVLVTSATVPTGATIAISATPVARGKPGDTLFVASQGGGTVSITTNVTTPILMLGAVGANFGSIVEIGVAATSATTAGNFKCQIQINLSLKN